MDVLLGGGDGKEDDGSPRATPLKLRSPSNTSLFVGNLVFSVDDDELVKVFADAGFPTVNARVVRRRNGRSKVPIFNL